MFGFAWRRCVDSPPETSFAVSLLDGAGRDACADRLFAACSAASISYVNRVPDWISTDGLPVHRRKRTTDAARASKLVTAATRQGTATRRRSCRASSPLVFGTWVVEWILAMTSSRLAASMGRIAEGPASPFSSVARVDWISAYCRASSGSASIRCCVDAANSGLNSPRANAVKCHSSNTFPSSDVDFSFMIVAVSLQNRLIWFGSRAGQAIGLTE